MGRFCELTEACCMKSGETNLDPAFCKMELQLWGFSGDATLRAACLAELEQLAASGNCLWEPWNLDDPCVRVYHVPGGWSPPGGP